MKFIIAFACLVAAISAEDLILPNERIVTGQIIDAINDVSQSIKDAGLDPLSIKREAREYALPVPVIFNAAGFVEDLLSTGLSDIRINRMNFGVLTSRLDFDLELPHIHISATDVYGQATIFDNKLEGEVSGSVDVNSIRIVGRVQVRIGVITGISVTSVTINFTLDSIDSQLKIGFQDYDLSNFVNNFLGNTIPDTLLEFRAEINELIEIVLFDIINANL